jgi:hypothetical protein
MKYIEIQLYMLSMQSRSLYTGKQTSNLTNIEHNKDTHIYMPVADDLSQYNPLDTNHLKI